MWIQSLTVGMVFYLAVNKSLNQESGEGFSEHKTLKNVDTASQRKERWKLCKRTRESNEYIS